MLNVGVNYVKGTFPVYYGISTGIGEDKNTEDDLYMASFGIYVPLGKYFVIGGQETKNYTMARASTYVAPFRLNLEVRFIDEDYSFNRHDHQFFTGVTYDIL